MEFFEQRLMVFAKRDDVEKLRQETSANFRKLKPDFRHFDVFIS